MDTNAQGKKTELWSTDRTDGENEKRIHEKQRPLWDEMEKKAVADKMKRRINTPEK